MRKFEKLQNDGSSFEPPVYENKTEAEAEGLKRVRGCKWREVIEPTQPKLNRLTEKPKSKQDEHDIS